jgi:hypothetical protein
MSRKWGSVEFKFAAKVSASLTIFHLSRSVLVRLPFYRSFQYGDMLQFGGDPKHRCNSKTSLPQLPRKQGIYSVTNYPAAIESALIKDPLFRSMTAQACLIA